MKRLMGKVDVTSWFSEDQSTSLTLDGNWMVAHLCPKKIFKLEFELLQQEEHANGGWGVVFMHFCCSTSMKSDLLQRSTCTILLYQHPYSYEHNVH